MFGSSSKQNKTKHIRNEEMKLNNICMNCGGKEELCEDVRQAMSVKN